MCYHRSFVSPLVERICSQEKYTQPSELLISEQAFDFDIEVQQSQATALKTAITVS